MRKAARDACAAGAAHGRWWRRQCTVAAPLLPLPRRRRFLLPSASTAAGAVLPLRASSGLAAASALPTPPPPGGATAATDAPDPPLLEPVFNAVQAALEAVHAAPGMPWWLTIVASTVVVRTAFLPLTVRQMHAGVRYARTAKPEADKLSAALSKARRHATDLQPLLLYGRGMRAVLRKHRCNPAAMFGGTLVMLPSFLVFVLTTRRMIRDPELGGALADGGALWFNNLTVPDETFVLPLLAVSLTYVNLELSLGKSPPGTVLNWLKDKGQMLLMMGLPLTTGLPQGVFLYWVTSASYGLVQTTALRSDGVRAALGLPPMGPGAGGMPAVPKSINTKEWK